MSPFNVVPFEPASQDRMARRGAPDKSRPLPPETVEVQCPHCAAVLCLEAGILSMGPELLCAGCDTTIPITRGGAAEAGS